MTAQSDPGLDRRVNGISGGSAVPETERYQCPPSLTYMFTVCGSRELSGSSIMEGSVKGKKKRAWPKKCELTLCVPLYMPSPLSLSPPLSLLVPKFYRKPRKKIRKFIIELVIPFLYSPV